MTKLIVVIRIEHSYCSDEISRIVGESTTEWSEVTDEEYDSIRRYAQYKGDLFIVEKPDLKEVVEMSLDYMIKEGARLKKQEEIRKKQTAEAAAKRKAAEKETKRRRLEKLAKEMGVTLAPPVAK